MAVKQKPKRKAISKSVRFEVLKRDNFKCQYCGAEAPNVLLQIDHINPVSKGGGNDLINLITSCFDCNNGKRAKKLDDDSQAQKQRRQLEQLQERREQLEMMMQWHTGLKDLEDSVINKVRDYWEGLTPGSVLNESGIKSLKALLKKFELSEILKAMDIVSEKYFRYEDDELTNDSVNNGFNKIGGVITMTRAKGDDPHLSDMYYIRGIIRNRFGKCNTGMQSKELFDELRSAIESGWTTDELKKLAADSNNYTNFLFNIST